MKKLCFGVVMALLVSSCLYEKGATVDPTTGTTFNCDASNNTNTGGVAPLAGEACFDKEIEPIFKANCAINTCHDSKSHQDGYDFSSYTSILKKGINTKAPKQTDMYKVITSTRDQDRMPPAPRNQLSQTEINLIVKWMGEGAKNTACKTATDLNNITFAASVKPILDANCVGCHGRGVSGGGVNLESYAAVKVVANNKMLFGVISQQAGYNAMPQGGRLSDCDIATIKKWIDNGALNN